MSRVHSVSSFVVVLALGVQAHAFDQDGPPPINTTRSISAGADEDIVTQGDVDTRELSDHLGHPIGSYMGVVPGVAAAPPHAAANRAVHADKQAAVTITWPGFQMRADGSSRVFIQSTAPLAPQSSSVAGKYQVRLPGARVAAATNRLPLDTRYFNTPVTKVSLSADRSGATLSLELRGDVSPRISSEPDKGGYFFTYIELPAGSYLPKAPQPVAAAAATPAVATQPAAAAPDKAAPRRPSLTRSHRARSTDPAELQGRLVLPE